MCIVCYLFKINLLNGLYVWWVIRCGGVIALQFCTETYFNFRPSNMTEDNVIVTSGRSVYSEPTMEPASKQLTDVVSNKKIHLS